MVTPLALSGKASQTFALIPAGGKSVRMGRPKLALPLGGRSVLEQVIDALRRAAIESILVVVGPHVPELAPLAEAAGAQVLLLAAETADMRATVERGLHWLEERFQPRPDDNWLLVPGDYPTLDTAVVRQLLESRAANPGYSIILPTYQGRRGHPTLIGWKHVAGIRTLPAGQGLNVYLRQQAAETLEMPVRSADILRDLDTPEDYERLLQTWEQSV
jgi:molybdenum cofactor cytidylyltransferase